MLKGIERDEIHITRNECVLIYFSFFAYVHRIATNINLGNIIRMFVAYSNAVTLADSVVDYALVFADLVSFTVENRPRMCGDTFWDEKARR